MYCLRKTSYMWHADHIIIYYHINQLFLGGTSPKVVVSCTKTSWRVYPQPLARGKGLPRVEKADPYPYPSVPNPKPMRVFKPLTITSVKRWTFVPSGIQIIQYISTTLPLLCPLALISWEEWRIWRRQSHITVKPLSSYLTDILIVHLLSITLPIPCPLTLTVLSWESPRPN